MQELVMTDAQWAWKTAGHAAMCILEGFPLWDEPREEMPTAEETLLNPNNCIDSAGTVALRLARHGGCFREHQTTRIRLKRVLADLEMDERGADQIVKLKESIAEKRLRANWAGVEAIAQLLQTDASPPAKRVREVFSAAIGQ